jgi:hypothetical protein
MLIGNPEKIMPKICFDPIPKSSVFGHNSSRLSGHKRQSREYTDKNKNERADKYIAASNSNDI